MNDDYFITTKYGPTNVVQYGLTDDISKSTTMFENVNRLIFVVPGNPGIIKCYKYMMKVLSQELNLPVIGFSHIGHSSHLVNTVKGSITLSKQVYHKLDLIEKYIPSHVEIILVGHSIGSEIALQLTRLLKQVKSEMPSTFLLFPSIESMASLDEAKFLTKLFNFKWLFLPLVMLLSILSNNMKLKIINKVVPAVRDQKSPPCIIEAILDMVNWRVTNNIITMAEDEFPQVELIDENQIRKYAQKFTFVYGRNDHWAPVDAYDVNQVKFPDCDMSLVDIPHAFVMEREHTDFVVNIIVSKLKDKQQ